MKTMSVTWNGRDWPKCNLYEPKDEPGILDVLFE